MLRNGVKNGSSCLHLYIYMIIREGVKPGLEEDEFVEQADDRYEKEKHAYIETLRNTTN